LKFSVFSATVFMATRSLASNLSQNVCTASLVFESGVKPAALSACAKRSGAVVVVVGAGLVVGGKVVVGATVVVVVDGAAVVAAVVVVGAVVAAALVLDATAIVPEEPPPLQAPRSTMPAAPAIAARRFLRSIVYALRRPGRTAATVQC
jgi:hypothetical protein